MSCSERTRLRATAVRDALPWLILVITIAVALVLRLYGLAELTLFYGDQGRDATVVRAMVQDGEFPLLGPAVSLGTYQRGPAFYYLLAPAFAISGGDPAGGATATALADVCTVFLLAMFGRAVAGWPAGLAAAGLWATSPWTTEFARFMWNPQFAPPFILLVLLSLVGLGRGHSRWVLLLLPAWAIAWQLHDQAMLLGPLVLIWWLLVRPRVRPAHLIVSVALAALVTLPFFVFEASHGFANLRAMATQVTGGGTPAGDQDSPLAAVVSGAGLLVPPTSWVSPLFWSSVVAGLIWLLASMRGAARPEAILLVLLTATSLLYAFWPGQIQTYYLYLVMPVPFLLFGTTLGAAWSWQKSVAIFLLLLGGAVAVVGVVMTATMLRGLSENPRTLGNMKSQIAAIAAASADVPYAVRLVSQYDSFGSWDAPYRYLLDHVLGQSPGRADLPTVVIYDSLELDGSAGGQHVAGASLVRFPAPSVGPELIHDDGLTSLGENGGWVAAGENVDLVHEASSTSLRIGATSAAHREVRVPAAGRYMLRVEYQCTADAKATRVLAEARDAEGVMLSTSFDPAGNLSRCNSAWSLRSFYVEAPHATSVIAIKVENHGAGNLYVRIPSLRAVTSPFIPGAAVR